MEVNVRIAGAAGQGTQTTAQLLGKAATRAGLFGHCHTDAESRIRGGLNFSHLRLSDRPRAGVVKRVDILVAHTDQAVQVLGDLSEGSVLLSQVPTKHPRALPIDLSALARGAGSEKAVGGTALGAVAELVGLPAEIVEGVLRDHFGERAEVLGWNLRAAAAGAEAARGLALGERFRLPGGSPAGRLWLSGAQAIALGAVAGGLSFFAGYPMSPATGIMAALVDLGPDAGVHVEQSEDEIAAINMVAAASYCGARAMSATSGGGFCLMTEGISLLGMIEAPAVIALAQRPGPATGLPTRLAQGDLDLARHAGHGVFPKILLAPRNIPDAFEVAARAFDLAERFQSPVILLTDQLLNEGSMTCDVFDPSGLPAGRYFVPPEELASLPEYRRYAWADDGLSPMAMPGKSRHLVYAASDEHDELGHITESGEIADRMVRKRLAKGDSIAGAAWTCEPSRDPAGVPLVLSWGSTYETVREALELNGIRSSPLPSGGAGGGAKVGSGAAHLHLRWLWPPPPVLAEAVRRASRVIVVEASAAGALGRLVREVALRAPEVLVTRRDGRPFKVDELAAELEPHLARER